MAYYSIPLNLDPLPAYRGVYVELIFDLPQVNVFDARNNPFVKDLIESPFVRSYLDRSHNVGLSDIFLVSPYQGDPTAMISQEVKVVYQNIDFLENPGLHIEFNFYIMAVVSAPVSFPEKEFNFTVRGQYDEYWNLFVKDALVIPHRSVTQPPYQLHSYLIIRTQIAVVDLCMVNNVSNQQGQQTVMVFDQHQSVIAITPVNKGMIQPIRLTDELLQLLGFTLSHSSVYGYPAQEHFDLQLQNSGITLLRYGSYFYTLLVHNPHAVHGCMSYNVKYLHQLQQYILANYQKEYLPDPMILKPFLQSVVNRNVFAANYRHFLSEYRANNPMPTTIPNFVAAVSRHYSVDYQLAEELVTRMVRDGELVL